MKIFFIFFLLSIIHTVLGQQNSFFAKLQTEKVNSDPKLEWTVIGPGNSGYSEELYIHPTDSKTMFLNYDMGNAYRTTDKSKSWKTLNDPDGRGSDIRPNWISFSLQDPDYGVMLEKGNIRLTTDKGKNWEKIENVPTKKKHSVITIDPNNKKTWYVGAGQYWRVKNVHRSLKHKHGTKINYTDYGHIYKTDNAGKTWTKIMTNISKDLDIGRIIIDPRNSNYIYVLSNFGIYKSKDAGISWEEAKTGLPYNDVRDLTHYFNKKTNEFFLYCVLQTHYNIKGNTTSAQGGIFKSADGAESWINITGNLNFDLQKTNHPLTKWGYFRTIAYWFGKKLGEIKKLAPELPAKTLPVFNRITVNPLDQNEIYISSNIKHDYSFGPSELLRTLDGGKTWVTAFRAGKYWKDQKDKNYWKSINTPLGVNAKFAHLNVVNDIDHIIGIRLMEMNSDGEIIICYEQQHLISKDHGETWHQIDDDETTPSSGNWVGRGDSNLPGFGLNLNTKEKGKYLFYTEEHGIWKSTLDGNLVKPGATALRQIEGQSTNYKKHSVSITSLTIDPNNPKIYYTLSNRQRNAGCFRKSTDAGNTWKNISQPIEGMKSKNLIYLFSLVVDKDNSKDMAFCVPTHTERGWHPWKWIKNNKNWENYDRYGVFYSSDGGLTWQNDNKGLPKNANVHHLSYDHNYQTLYAAIASNPDNAKGGLYKSMDNGKSWKKMKLPDNIYSVKHIKVDNKGTIYIATGDGKAAVGQGGVFRSYDNGKTWELIFDMPNTNRVAISKVDPNLIGVVVAPNKKIKFLNPGIYISKNNGKTWKKSNKGLGQPDKIEGFDFDPYNKNIFWSTSHGSGFAKGVLK